MPLTLPTHPIAVVPLKLLRPHWFDGVALTIGAVAPDIAYALHGFGPVLYTHNLPGLFWWALPVTLIAARLVRWAAPAIAAHLPGGGPLRLADYGVLGVVRHRWQVTVVSAVIGALSHVAWDAVTHPGHVPALRHEVWPGMPWWGLLSDASNLAGLAVAPLLAVRIGRHRLLRTWHGPPPRVTQRPVVFWSGVAVALLCGLILLLAHPAGWAAAQAIRIMLACCLALLCGAAAVRMTLAMADSVR